MTAADAPYVIIARLQVRAGSEDAVAEAVEALVRPSRAEPGCLAYYGHRSADDARVFAFYERWANEAAYVAHTETPHFERWVRGVIGPAVESRQRDVYASLGEA